MQKLLALTRKAINDYEMIADGDSIAVGVSGGKDSTALLAVLAAYKKFAPEKFELRAINIDMGFKDTDPAQVKALRDWCDDIGVPLTVVKTDIAEIIFERRKESSPCSLCSKMRRGALNNAAIEAGCNKLALAHHADDVLGTFLLSLLFEGRLSTFAPKSYMSRTGVRLCRREVSVRTVPQAVAARRLQSVPRRQTHGARGRQAYDRDRGKHFAQREKAYDERAVPPRTQQPLAAAQRLIFRRPCSSTAL